MNSTVLVMERPEFSGLIIKLRGCPESQCSGEPHFHLKQDPHYSRKVYALCLSYEGEIRASKGKCQRERDRELEVFESLESPMTSAHNHLGFDHGESS